jgi:hypothetical protein
VGSEELWLRQELDGRPWRKSAMNLGMVKYPSREFKTDVCLVVLAQVPSAPVEQVFSRLRLIGMSKME